LGWVEVGSGACQWSHTTYWSARKLVTGISGGVITLIGGGWERPVVAV
jgi:hypothetical protein